MIVFSNPGVMDVRCITTMGINVKETDTPIGFFGTGLKMALAVLLRTGHTVRIYGGHTCYEFTTYQDSVRGKEFNFIEMHQSVNGIVDYNKTQKLGFTTDLGKHWEPWMAYRELYSNCTDEKGEVTAMSDEAVAKPDPAYTFITVTGPLIDGIHNERDKYFLFSDPIWANNLISIHHKRDNDMSIFYRGIKAGVLDKASNFTYNIKAQVPLSEDRAFANIYAAKHLIGKSIVGIDDLELLNEVFDGVLELGLDYDWTEHKLSPAVNEWIMAQAKGHKAIPVSLRAAMKRESGIDIDKLPSALPDSLAGMILGAPEVVTKEPMGTIGGIYDLIRLIQELRTQNDYWHNCIKKLAEAQDMTSPRVPTAAQVDAEVESFRGADIKIPDVEV